VLGIKADAKERAFAELLDDIRNDKISLKERGELLKALGANK
jgi:hypothetical protein